MLCRAKLKIFCSGFLLLNNLSSTYIVDCRYPQGYSVASWTTIQFQQGKIYITEIGHRATYDTLRSRGISLEKSTKVTC